MPDCNHSIRHGPLCALCGETIQTNDTLFCLLHNTDTIRTTSFEANKIARKRKKELDTEKKLILIIDLDHTLIHATLNQEVENLNINIVNLEESVKDVSKSTSYGVDHKRKMTGDEKPVKHVKIEEEDVLYVFRGNRIKYFIRVRPFCKELLDFCYDKYEMHVYTMGNRMYADNVVKIIDPDGKYFESRIISRDENMDQRVKTMDRLSSDHRNIVILDDRGDVWKFCSNLVMIKPFFYFRCGDINAPDKAKPDTSETSNGIYSEANEDQELKYAVVILKNIYNIYFNGLKNIRRVMRRLRFNIFVNKRFMIDINVKYERKSVKNIIKNCNGKLKRRRIDYIIASEVTESALEMQRETRADIVDIKWILACYLYFQPFDFNKYMLKTLVDDDLVKEFEDLLD